MLENYIETIITRVLPVLEVGFLVILTLQNVVKNQNRKEESKNNNYFEQSKYCYKCPNNTTFFLVYSRFSESVYFRYDFNGLKIFVSLGCIR